MGLLEPRGNINITIACSFYCLCTYMSGIPSARKKGDSGGGVTVRIHENRRQRLELEEGWEREGGETFDFNYRGAKIMLRRDCIQQFVL